MCNRRDKGKCFKNSLEGAPGRVCEKTGCVCVRCMHENPQIFAFICTHAEVTGRHCVSSVIT